MVRKSDVALWASCGGLEAAPGNNQALFEWEGGWVGGWSGEESLEWVEK